MSNIRYKTYGECRNSLENFPTDRLFTGQRLDQTGLYFYNARYYDATIGRFVSPDTIIPVSKNPQSFNRYSYALNNPLKYEDPSGHIVTVNGVNINDLENAASSGNYLWLINQSDTLNSSSFQAYVDFRADYSAIANILEKSDLIYKAQSETSNVNDIYITNSQRVQSNFTMLMPGGYGTVSYSVDTVWHQGTVSISVFTATTVIFPETSYGYTGVSIDGRGLTMHRFKGPQIVRPNTNSQYGTVTFDGFSDNKLQVDFSLSATTHSTDPSDYSYHQIIRPASWHVIVWEGTRG